MTIAPRRVSVLIVDDHEVVRTGLRVTLEAVPDLLVRGTARNGREALAMLAHDPPDVLITDLRMPRMDGLELMREAHRLLPGLPVLLLTVVEDPHLIREALDAGANGYLLKSSSAQEIMDAVHRALDGELVVSGSVGSIIATQLTASGADRPSERELEVLECVARGRTNAQIAGDLHISETTVRTHLRRSYTKLGAQDRTSAVTEALRRGLITLD